MIQAGVAGFKCFLIHSGVDEFPHVTEADLHTAMRQLQGTGSVLLVSPVDQSSRICVYYQCDSSSHEPSVGVP